jgi:hypothetical protein
MHIPPYYKRVRVYSSVWGPQNDSHVLKQVAHLVENWWDNINDVTEFPVYFLWVHNMMQHCTISEEREFCFYIMFFLPVFLDMQLPAIVKYWKLKITFPSAANFSRGFILWTDICMKYLAEITFSSVVQWSGTWSNIQTGAHQLYAH